MKVTEKTIVYFFIVIIIGSIGTIMTYPISATDPFKIIAIVSLLNVVTTILLGLLTNDYSWTDLLWSTIPVLFAWIYASAAEFATISSIAGPMLLTLLFIGSVWFTESIASGKYPDYQEYQKRTWPILPKPW